MPKISALSADTAPSIDDLLVSVNDPSGTPANKKVAIIDLLNTLIGPQPPCARLTTESNVPVSTSDRTSQGTIYWTPYKGSKVWLYTSSKWTPYTLTQISLALTLTSGKNYDVFVYDNSGTLTLELSAAWTDDTTRADALTTQNGMYVKSGATNKLHIGTIRASGTNVTEDSAAKRFVWNRYNQTLKSLILVGSGNWAYATTTIRQANATATNRVEYVTGDVETEVDVFLYVDLEVKATAGVLYAGLGVDSTTVFSGLTVGTYFDAAQVLDVPLTARYNGFPGLGYHAINWLEKGNSGTVAQYYAATGNIQGGLSGKLLN